MSRVGPIDSIVKQRVIARSAATKQSSFSAAGLLRFARNDVQLYSRNANCAQVGCVLSPNRGRRECRAPQCTRSLACENKKHDELVTTVTPETPGIPRAMVLTVSFVLFLVSRAFLPPSPAGCRRKLDASVGALEPHDFAVSLARRSSKAPKRPPHPVPRS